MVVPMATDGDGPTDVSSVSSRCLSREGALVQPLTDIQRFRSTDVCLGRAREINTDTWYSFKNINTHTVSHSQH